jgi:large-conductance mechanosensitive channel
MSSTNSKSTSEDKSSFVILLKKFIVDNTIVGAISGIAIGLFFTKVVTSFVGDIVIPAVVLLLIKCKFTYIESVFSQKKDHQFNFTSFIKSLISFIVGVMVTFLFVQASFIYLIDVDTSSKPPETTTTPALTNKESFFSY